MTQFLPPNLLALFAPRDPIPYLPPLDKLPHEKKNSGYIGVGAFLGLFEDPKDTPPPTRVETREERLERKRREKAEQAAYKLEQDIALWDPLTNPSSTSDPYKSLFVARINYDTTESKLRREFEVYGPIRKIVVVHDRKTGKPRGYAFIEYEHERDMHSAYKHADGKKIDGRRVLVDVERARTVKGWLPRRLGGGLGGTRRGGPEVNVKHSGREEMRPGEDRERRRSRSRSPFIRERRRRSRSRSREREVRDRRRDRKRRSRDRSRSREKDRDRDGGLEERMDGAEVGEIEDRKERDRRRSRSRDRDRKRNRRSRSKSRDRERKRRDRDRDRERDRDRREKDREPVEYKPVLPLPITIKQEIMDDGYGNGVPSEYPDGAGDGFGFPSGGQYDDYNNKESDNATSQFNNYYSNVTIKQEPPD